MLEAHFSFFQLQGFYHKYGREAEHIKASIIYASIIFKELLGNAPSINCTPPIMAQRGLYSNHIIAISFLSKGEIFINYGERDSAACVGKIFLY